MITEAERETQGETNGSMRSEKTMECHHSWLMLTIIEIKGHKWFVTTNIFHHKTSQTDAQLQFFSSYFYVNKRVGHDFDDCTHTWYRICCKGIFLKFREPANNFYFYLICKHE